MIELISVVKKGGGGCTTFVSRSKTERNSKSTALVFGMAVALKKCWTVKKKKFVKFVLVF